jgi:hypothetical protein
MSTLTVQPSAPIVAPLLADWLLDLLPPGQTRRISPLLPRGPDTERNLSNAHSLDHAMLLNYASGVMTSVATLPLGSAPGVERYHMHWHLGRAATSRAPNDRQPSAHHRCGLLTFHLRNV